ncbi:Response regulator receiver domain-containing protein [Halovenus aranensis]|jgi:DNA-binding response OmpR family regulator|uniref:Response regulator receiver domain-containing protein n=1 Tax=Halovenus aranensis TaxID=890420 RepID=A0A1G8U495_9EURY|nr:HalX domain-containing protein [Halovenus aranensis]SDJ48561.1 Response regulator receiver domain-containing protein [Halovenus aranensis]
MAPSDPVVLIVEDESDVAETYRLWLTRDYTVRVAEDGDAGLEKLDDAVDVVLLDRRMPGLSGGDVLEEIRSRKLDCRVAMVTAVEPDFDILEMGFDSYLEKPVKSDRLQSTVRDLLERSAYDSVLQEYYSLVEKRAALEASKPVRELETSEEYRDLRRRIEHRREELSETLGGVDDEDDFITTIRELGDTE